jgi:peroxiredoxin
LSDFPHLKVIRAYGGLNKQWDSTTAQRYFFLIDQQGIVRGKWPGKVDEVFPSEPILKVAREISGKR